MLSSRLFSWNHNVNKNSDKLDVHSLLRNELLKARKSPKQWKALNSFLIERKTNLSETPTHVALEFLASRDE